MSRFRTLLTLIRTRRPPSLPGSGADRHARLLPGNSPTSQILTALGARFRLYHHLPHRRSGSRRALLPPGFQPFASFFHVLEEMRILESGAPRRTDRPHTVPHHPNLAITVEKQFVVDQPAIHDPGHHVPVADHHADVSVFLPALRIPLHHLFRR